MHGLMDSRRVTVSCQNEYLRNIQIMKRSSLKLFDAQIASHNGHVEYLKYVEEESEIPTVR